MAGSPTENAWSAAFRDPRFPPLEESELADLEIHISVLTPAEPMGFESSTLDAADVATVEAARDAGVRDAAVRDDAAEVQAQFDQRREEDLLAEAKVFFKYGLQEKARDRLGELFQVRPNHLEGLDLQTRIDLDAGLSRCRDYYERICTANG